MKDEGARMGLKAFKALGVGFALSEEIRRREEIETLKVSLSKISLGIWSFMSDKSVITNDHRLANDAYLLKL